MVVSPYGRGFEYLTDALSPSAVHLTNPYKGMGFVDFIFEVFAKSALFDGKNFDTWHVYHIAEIIESSFTTGRNVCVVMPRLHLKSTICGHATSIWRMVCSEARDTSCLYLSYKDGLAKYHAEEIKKIIDGNPLLSKVLLDMSPQSASASRYKVAGGGTARIMTGGVFSFKRGLHVNGVVHADDILRDPQNPLSIGQLMAVEQHVNSEIMHIPNKGTPLIIMGTPMHASDILLKLKDNPEFDWIYLPARGPTDKKYYDVLWPDMYDDAWLKRAETAGGWKSFQTEFMLTPVYEVEAYITRNEIAALFVPEGTVNWPLGVPRPWEEDEIDVIGGYDVGKKRHPSHLMIFARKKRKKANPKDENDLYDENDCVLWPIHQSFHDGVDYEVQAAMLNDVVEHFGLTKLYVDNTRAEMDERGLVSECKLVTFTSKFRKEAASAFTQAVSLKRVRFFDESRYVSQILSVNSNLQAPETSLGHGESFFSTMLAVYGNHLAWNTTGIQAVNLGDAWNSLSPSTQGNVQTVSDQLTCVKCGEHVFVFQLANGFWPTPMGADKMRCLDCGELQDVPEDIEATTASSITLRSFAPAAFNSGPESGYSRSMFR